MPWTLALVLQTLLAQGSPMLSYQAMEELKGRLATQIVEVEVVRMPAPGEAPSFITPLAGQGVCIRGPGGQIWLVVSQFLVLNAGTIKARTKQLPEWQSVKVAYHIPALGLALIQPGTLRQGCVPTSLAPGATLTQQPVAYTVDSPTGYPNIFWAILDTRAEPPLQQFLISPVGLPLSYPLFSQQGELLGLNIRPYVPGRNLALAVTSLQMRRLLYLRAPWSTQRVERRGVDRRGVE